jgi:predicted MFS family arabinose efflux permease
MSILTAIRAARAPLASFAALGVLWGAFTGMAPSTKAMLGVDDAGWGAMFLCSSAGALLATRFAPRVAGALGRGGLPVATLAFAAAFALPGHLSAPVAFGAAMAVVGMTAGTLDVLMNARVSAIEAERNMHLMSLHHATFSFAYALSAGLTGPARAAGFGPATGLTVAAVIVALLALLTVERDGRIGDPPASEGAPAPLGLIPLIGGFVLLTGFLAENATEIWSALHIERTLGGARGLGSYGPALLGLTMGIGRLSGQVLSSRLRERMLLTGAALTGAAGALIAALAPSVAAGYLGFVVLGLGVSVIAPVALALTGRLVPASRRTQAIARTTMIGYMGFFIGPAALGPISEALGLRAAFGTVAAMLLLILPLVRLMARRRAAPA